jgi:hypothetical protein
VDGATKGLSDSALLYLNRSSGFSSPDDPSELRLMKIQSLCEIRGYLRDVPGPVQDVPLSAVRCCVRDGSVSIYRREENRNNSSSSSSSSSSSPHGGCSDLETTSDTSATKWARARVDRGRGSGRSSAESSRMQGHDSAPDLYSAPHMTLESGRKRNRVEDSTNRLTEGQRDRLQKGDDEVSTISSLSVVVAGLIADDILQLWSPLKALIAALKARLQHLDKNDLER